MASSIVRASELGKCYAQAEDGYYRLYKVDGMWAIYLVTREMIWSDDNTSYKYGKGLEAVLGGYISDPENFEDGIDAIKEEIYYLSC